MPNATERDEGVLYSPKCVWLRSKLQSASHTFTAWIGNIHVHTRIDIEPEYSKHSTAFFSSTWLLLADGGSDGGGDDVVAKNVCWCRKSSMYFIWKVHSLTTCEMHIQLLHILFVGSFVRSFDDDIDFEATIWRLYVSVCNQIFTLENCHRRKMNMCRRRRRRPSCVGVCVCVCIWLVIGGRGNISCRVGRMESNTIYSRYLNFSLCMSKCHEIVIYISYSGDDMRKQRSE